MASLETKSIPARAEWEPQQTGFLQKMYHTMRLSLQAIALAFHLLLGLVAALSAMRILNESLKTRLISAWSKILLFILRIKVFSDYKTHASHAIVVANHVSWIDAFVIGSLNGLRFVVRSDVAQCHRCRCRRSRCIQDPEQGMRGSYF